jgi:hypothetical protein
MNNLLLTQQKSFKPERAKVLITRKILRLGRILFILKPGELIFTLG